MAPKILLPVCIFAVIASLTMVPVVESVRTPVKVENSGFTVYQDGAGKFWTAMNNGLEVHKETATKGAKTVTYYKYEETGNAFIDYYNIKIKKNNFRFLVFYFFVSIGCTKMRHSLFLYIIPLIYIFYFSQT